MLPLQPLHIWNLHADLLHGCQTYAGPICFGGFIWVITNLGEIDYVINSKPDRKSKKLPVNEGNAALFRF